MPLETQPIVPGSPLASSSPPSPQEKNKKRKPQPKKFTKNFSTPQKLDKDSCVTYIDHDCKLYKEEYPLYPNQETVFIQMPGKKITNFGKVGFTNTMHNSKLENPGWRTVHITCLGVVCCTNLHSLELGLPPPCMAYGCKGQKKYIECGTTACRVDYDNTTGWAVLCHSGFHNHPWPDLKKADPLAQKELMKKVIADPNKKPLAHKVGTAGNGQLEVETVSEINPSFAHKDQLAYLQRKILVANGLMPEKESKGGSD
ncbi:hypothetical protein CROQUDRAFT_691884, partial [Cronartium quercuum f. sp. fusiforme G11]